MSLTLDIRLLGGFSLTYGDRPVTGLNTARSQALLVYLILHRHAPEARQRVAFHLWPDSTDNQARANLRKELSYLRRILPNADQFLLVDTKTLQWQPNAPFTLDVAQFEAAIKTADQEPNSHLAQAALQQAVE